MKITTFLLIVLIFFVACTASEPNYNSTATTTNAQSNQTAVP